MATKRQLPPLSEGFVRHSRRSPPPHPEALVEVQFRDGSIARPRLAKTWRWQHISSRDDIVAYRVLIEAADEDAECI
ncbi:hypothetical protein V3589_11370 [Sinorhizobium fredii]|uniref:hypothetical protein n=1 Tax=Rhizobium fredii TaxID=380 RepID=UPI0030B47944